MTGRNERNSRAERSKARALRLESLESRELLSVAPGSEILANDALAVYESSVATNADEILDITECMLDDSDVAPAMPEWTTISTPAPVAAGSPTSLTAPTLTVEGKTGLTIAVSWNAVPNAERYSLSYKPSNTTTWTNKNVGTNTSYTISRLALDTSYDIRLKAIGDGVNYKSVYSPTIQATTDASPDPSETPVPLATPTVKVAGKTGTTITVKWDAVDNVVRYSVGYKLPSDTIWTNKNVGTNLSYTITGLEKTTDYDVRVKAIGDGEIYKSVYSPAVRAATDASLTPLATPVLSVAGKTGSTITVNWGAVANAERYSLSYRPANTETWTNVNIGTNRSYKISGLDVNTTYEVRLKAIADGVTYKSVYSAILSAKTEATPDVPVGPVPLATPSLTVAAVGPSFLTINWEAVPNALRYSFSYKLSSSSEWTNKNVGTNTSYTITGLALNTEYDVRLKAVGDETAYKSVYSPILRVETAAELIPLETPRATAEATPTSVTVSWDEVPNAVRYGVSYRLAGASEWTNVNAGTNLSYTIEGLDPTTEYDVRVRAVGDGSTYDSAYSAVVRVQTLEGDWPTITTIDVSNDSMLVHWEPTPNAAGYYVACAPVGSTNFIEKYVVAPTAYTRITGLAANTEYQIKIRVATYESTSEFSPVVTRTTSTEPVVTTALAAPTISARGISSDALYVEWTSNPRATGYVVSYRERTASEYSTINVAASETGLVLGGLDSDTSYYVRVRAVGDNVFWSSSSYSAAQSVKTKDGSFLSTAEYEELRDRYDRLLLPESMADVNIVVLEDWTAEEMIDAIDAARSTTVDDVILLDPEYFDEPLDLSGETITLDVDYETSGAISILSRGFDPDLDRAQIKVNGDAVTFDAIAGLTQFGGVKFVDVNPEVSVYQVTSTPALGVLPTVVDTQGVDAFTSSDIAVWTAENSLRGATPIPSANPSADDYALLFIGGSNARANMKQYFVTMYDYYKELVEDFSLDPTHIYILYADGDVSGTSLNVNSGNEFNDSITTSDLTFATELNTTVRAATGAELSLTLSEIADLMTEDSHLLFWTYDHGDGVERATTNHDDYLCGWGEKITGASVRDALFQIPRGYATCVFTQCFSGGILDDIFDPSNGKLRSVANGYAGGYDGAAHFAGGAATNHYEVSLTGLANFVGYFGYAQTFGEALRYRSTGVAAFEYTEQNEYYSLLNQTRDDIVNESYRPNEGLVVAKMEHPWHAGESFSIFTTSPEYSAPTITSHSTTTDSITLTWTAVPNATSYTLEYVPVGGTDAIIVEDVPTNSYTLTGLIPAMFYTLKVKANNSPYSPQTTVMTDSGGFKETPSTVVTTADDMSSESDGKISLREAIKYAQSGDTITFDPSLQGKTIKLTSSLTNTIASKSESKSFTIDASGLYDSITQTPGLTISGEGKRILSLTKSSFTSTPTVEVTIKGIAFIHGYTKSGHGAVISNKKCDLTVENCVFRDNNPDAGLLGGAIAVEQSGSLTMNSAVFSGNTGRGVVYFDTDAESSIVDCVFENNGTFAVYDNQGAVTMTNCVVKGNEDSGLYVEPLGNLTAINTLIAENTASNGAGLQVNGTASLYYCTVAGNAASLTGGGVYLSKDAVLNAYNTVIAGNTATNGGADVENVNGSANGHNVLTSYLNGWDTEEALYSYDTSQPLFSDAAHGDYTLAESSQAINKGNASFVPTGATVTTDLQGGDRVADDVPDLGAYEFQNLAPPLATPTNVSASATTNSITVSWDAVADAASYRVEYKPANAAEWTTWSDSVAATSATITNLTQGTQYSARVTAVSGDLTLHVNSAPSQPVSLWTQEPLPAPSITVATDVHTATIYWTAVQNASGYALSYKESSEPDVAANWTVVGDIAASATSVTLDNLFGATQYDFKLVATGDGTRYVDSAPSLPATAVVKEKLAPAPTITVTPDVNSATVGWTAVQNAFGYRVSYKKTDDADLPANWTVVNLTGPQTSSVIDGLDGATDYDFSVVARGDGTWYVNSDASAPATATILERLASVSTVAATPGVNTATVTWTAVEHASGYALSYKKTDDADVSANWTVVDAISVSDTSYTATNLDGATSYDFIVVAKGDGTSYADSYASVVAPAIVKAKLLAPTITDVAPGNYTATVGWTGDANASGYTFSYRKSNESSWTNRNLPPTQTSVTLPELEGATQYEVRIAAQGDGTWYVGSDPSAPTSLIVSAKLETPTITATPAVNSATVAWTAINHASSYSLSYKKTSESSWTVVGDISASDTSYAVANLDGATSYDFKLVAVGDGAYYVNSDASAVESAVVKERLETPTIAVDLTVVNSATVSWTAVQNASSYALSYKKTNDADNPVNWTVVDGISPSATSVTVDALVGGSQYDFKLVAKGDGTSYDDSDASAVVSGRVARKLDAPTNFASTSALDSISVSWGAVEDAVGYDVSYALAGTNNWSTPERVDSALSWTKSLSFGTNGPSGGKTYEVQVIAVASGYDVSSDAATTSVASQSLVAPTVVAKNTGADVPNEIFSATISWNAVDYATGYAIEYAVGDYNDGELVWTFPESTQATTWFNNTDLLPNTLYSYRLRATAGGYYSDPTMGTFKIEVEPRPIGTPTITVTPAVESATVSWGAVQNASSYTLSYKKTDDADIEANWTNVADITATSYPVANLDGATQYDFKLVAKGNQLIYLDSDPSAVVTATIQEQLAPAPTIAVTPSVNSATVTWNAVQHASGYALFYKKTNDADNPVNWTVVGDIAASATSYTVDGLDGATQYDFKLVATGDGAPYVDSDASAVVAEIIPAKLVTPTITEIAQQTFAVEPDTNSATVTWTAVQNASSYTLSYKTTGESTWTVVDGIPASDTSYAIDGLSGATQYDFRVVAEGDGTSYWDSNPSDESLIVKAKLDTPTITATPSVESATVSWGAVQNASSYKLSYKKTSESTWTVVDNISASATSCVVDGLEGATKYDFKVVAVGDGTLYVGSDASDVVTEIIPAKLDTPTITVTPAVESATVSWGSVLNASSYSLSYKKTSESTWTVVDDISASATSYTVAGLDGATRYDFKLVAVGDGTWRVDSSDSAVVTEIIPARLETPTVTEIAQQTFAVAPNTNSATVTWIAVDHASSYRLSYKKTSESTWTVVDDISASDTSYVIAGLDGATQYDFRVVAEGDGTWYWDSNPSDVSSIVKAKLATPTNLDITQTSFYLKPWTNLATVSWDPVENASSYKLSYKKTSDPDVASSWTDVFDITSTSYSVDGLESPVEYDFRVVAVGDGTSYVDSASSQNSKIIKLRLSTPTITGIAQTSFVVKPGLNSATVTWWGDEDASSYTLSYKKASDSSWTTVAGITSANYMSTSYTVEDLEGDTEYNFKVAANQLNQTLYIDSFEDDASIVSKTIRAKLDTPTISSVNTSVVNKATVNWGAVANASSYSVYWKKTSDPDSSWVGQDNIAASATSYTVTNLAGATPYDFKVVAKDAEISDVDSDPSAVVPAIVKEQLPAPTGLTVTEHTDMRISVKWNAVAHASGYTVQYVGGGQTKTTTVSATTANLTVLNPATQYTISVKANGDGVSYADSPYSGTVVQKTKETPSVVVNSTGDTVDAYDGVITLREALITYRAQGTTVTFASNMSGQTILLNSTIRLTDSTTINASSLSSHVTISGQNNVRIFDLSQLTNKTFSINKVNFTQGKITGQGGGAAIDLSGSGSKLVLYNCSFTNNNEAGPAASGDDAHATRGGGAIFVGYGAQIDATYCTFSGNTTTQGDGHRGGAVHIYNGVGNFNSCAFMNNKSQAGGAVAYCDGTSGTMNNCLIVKNETNQRGGGVALMKNVDVTFKNCTIVKNTATQSGSGVYVWSNQSHGLFANCIVVQNASTSESGHNNFGYNSSMVSAPNIDGRKTMTSSNVTWKSGNNLVYDSSKALFVNVNSDWHLSGTGSQACNVGNNDYAATPTDLDGNNRLRGGTVDLGCFEVQAGSSALLDDDAELFEEFEIEDSLDLIAANLLDLE